MSYFMKLRNHYYQNKNNNILDNIETDDVFLNSEDINKVTTKLHNNSANSNTTTVQTTQNSSSNTLFEISCVTWTA